MKNFHIDLANFRDKITNTITNLLNRSEKSTSEIMTTNKLRVDFQNETLDVNWVSFDGQFVGLRLSNGEDIGLNDLSLEYMIEVYDVLHAIIKLK